MDDVDAVQAQIARNMLATGDYVTARLDGVPYLEKAPLIYWMMAGSYRLLGVSDWAARLPLALAAILLCWVTYRFGGWAFDGAAALYAGVATHFVPRDGQEGLIARLAEGERPDAAVVAFAAAPPAGPGAAPRRRGRRGRRPPIVRGESRDPGLGERRGSGATPPCDRRSVENS